MNGMDLIPQKQAAARLGVPVFRLYRWRRQGWPPPHYSLNGRIFYKVADLDAWVRSGRQE